MTMPDVVFLFDFGSPNAYLAHKVIPAIEARTGAKFAYVPVLLGGMFKATGNRSPVEAFAGIPDKLAYEGRETRPLRRAPRPDRATRSNPHFPVNTLAIMRGAVAAQTARRVRGLCRGGLRRDVGAGPQDGRSGGDRRGRSPPPACPPSG